MGDRVWTAKEAAACALCWAAFSNPEDRDDSPEQYWLGISERARQDYRAEVKRRLIVATLRGQAIALPPAAALSDQQWIAFGAAAGLTQHHRMFRLVTALREALLPRRDRHNAADRTAGDRDE